MVVLHGYILNQACRIAIIHPDRLVPLGNRITRVIREEMFIEMCR